MNILKSLADFSANNTGCQIADDISCYKRVDFNLILDNGGRIVSVLERGDKIRVPNLKVLDKNTGRISEWAKRTANIFPNLIVDNLKYVAGINDESKNGTSIRHTAYRELHTKLSQVYPSLLILTRFFDTLDYNIAVLLDYKVDWSGGEIVMFTTQEDNMLIHETEEVKNILLSNCKPAENIELKQCCICGEQKSIVRLIHNVKGIPDESGKSGIAAIMSCNSEVAEAYGKKQGEAFPTCAGCSAGITSAISYMLESVPTKKHTKRQAISIGDSRIAIFWSDNMDFNNDFSTMLDSKSTDPDEVRKVVESPIRGNKYATDISQFRCLVLSRNMQRIIVHDTFYSTIANVQSNINQYFSDIRYEDVVNYNLYSIYRSLLPSGTTSPKKLMEIKRDLEGTLFECAITGKEIPDRLVFRIVQMMLLPEKAGSLYELNIRNRCAILKAAINRKSRIYGSVKEVSMSLDESNSNPSYRFGRYFAISEYIQSIASPVLNKTIKDTYYSMCMSLPVLAFKEIDYLNNINIKKISKSKKGLSIVLERSIRDVCEQLILRQSPMNLEESALFILGYNHQKTHMYKRR